eukprot:TRINITY_DN15747_c0_g1_i1.p1 TRINITY_DN15747_c0_g1~~TRINITY_DN15747_c0_g1_i1.p1  ORF type:complete len:572 (+),score=191.40 TRINITY_DN15747_c0_g1_i1:494-2209(+)
MAATASQQAPSLDFRSFASVLSGIKVKVEPPQAPAINGGTEFDFDEVFASSTPRAEADTGEGLQRAGSSLGTVEEDAKAEDGERDFAVEAPVGAEEEATLSGKRRTPSLILSSRPGSPPHLITRQHSLRGPSAVLGELTPGANPSPHEGQTATVVWQQVEMVSTKGEEEIEKAGSPDGNSLPAPEIKAESGLISQPVEIISKPLSIIYSDSSGDEGASTSGREHVGNGNQKLGPSDFELLRVVGQGAFGKVFQVQKKDTGEILAMKVMRKERIMEKNHADYMKAERNILTQIVHPFIVTLRYSFQTRSKLYLLLDFINGGHLFFQLYRQGTFSEELSRFYLAEIVLAIAHLHEREIMHRDLKPENILLDAEGHLKITDFGLAKADVTGPAATNSMCGTMEYMAPEILLAKGHGKAADWWSLGILLFEMLTGEPPFFSNNRQKLQNKIIKDKLKLPAWLTSEASTLVKGLLNKDPARRLGSGPTGAAEIKGHKFFKAINWRKLEARQVVPPFRPAVVDQRCVANFDEMYTKLPVLDSPGTTPKGGRHNDFFVGYTYVAPVVWPAHLTGEQND